MAGDSRSEALTSLGGLTRRASLFVGRRDYLDIFEHGLQSAMSGRPYALFIEGEAGLGKTRLLRQMRQAAERSGMQVGFGRGYEDITVPYLPFIEALQPKFATLPGDMVRTLGADIGIIRRLLYEEVQTPPTIRLTMTEQDDPDKLRLFLAVSRLVLMLAQTQPILLAIDDLHWVDPPSLELLSYLVFAVAERMMQEPAPLLIVGAYRPVAPEHQLTRVMARVQREEFCRVHELVGLDETEMRELLSGIGISRPSNQLVTTIRDVTQGSPLFIEEMLYYLARQEALYEQEGYVVSTSSAVDLRLPEHVTGMVLARTQEVSEPCRNILTLASFLGERFTLKELVAAAQLAQDVVLNRVEEGMSHGLLLNEGQTFHFAHPLMRHVFYNAPSAVRRQLLHRQIADALEQLYAAHIESHWLAITHHLVRAGSAAEADAVVRYARRAGDRAFAIFAWREATHYYTAALAAAGATDLLSRKERADLHYLAGLAHLWDGDIGPCLEHYDRAIEGYRYAGDTAGLAQALMAKTHTYPAAVTFGTLADMQEIEEVLEDLEEDELSLRGHLLNGIAQIYWVAQHPDKMAEMASRALEIGVRLHDDVLCSFACFQVGVSCVQQMHAEEALEYYQQARRYASQATDRWLESLPLQRMPTALILLGRFDEIERIALEAYELASETNNWGHYSLTLAALASVAALRGDFAQVEPHSREALVMTSRYRYPFGGAIALPALASAYMSCGRWAEAEQVLDQLIEPGCVFDQPSALYRAITDIFRQLVRAHQLSCSEHSDAALPVVEPVPRPGKFDIISLPGLCALVELQVLSGDTERIGELYNLLSMAADRGVIFSRAWVFSIQRVLGLAAFLQERWEQAQAHFDAARETTSRLGARAELGRTLLDYARLLMRQEDNDQTARAFTLAQEAETIFAELNMAPFSSLAARLMQQLQERLDQSVELLPPATYRNYLSPHDAAILSQVTQSDLVFLG